MKKRILTCLLVLLFTGMAVRPVQAAGEHLVDSAGLLSQTEADTLRTQLEEISRPSGCRHCGGYRRTARTVRTSSIMPRIIMTITGTGRTAF